MDNETRYKEALERLRDGCTRMTPGEVWNIANNALALFEEFEEVGVKRWVLITPSGINPDGFIIANYTSKETAEMLSKDGKSVIHEVIYKIRRPIPRPVKRREEIYIRSQQDWNFMEDIEIFPEMANIKFFAEWEE